MRGKPSARAAVILAVVAVFLAVTGWGLISQALTVPSQAPRGAAGPAPTASSPTQDNTEPGTAPTPPRPRRRETPPGGEQRRADAAIQQVMDRSSRPDLPPAAERTLLRLGRQVLEADATGRGRERWPRYFENARPGHAYEHFRAQAAIARRDGSEDQAVVHLVWAGADRGGDYREGRVAAVRFINESDNKGRKQWVPRR